jgi:hypothetical protein
LTNKDFGAGFFPKKVPLSRSQVVGVRLNLIGEVCGAVYHLAQDERLGIPWGLLAVMLFK